MQESRLFKIIYYLLDKGQATAPELAERFEVSVRIIYRDINALSGSGIPIYAETGRNGGIHLLNDFVLDKAVLSKEEKQQILSALQSISIIGNTLEDDVLIKLSALFNINMEYWIEVDFSSWGKNDDNSKFELLKTAIIHHRAVNILYANSYGSKRKRKIYPIRLVYKSKAWYIKAYCTEKEDFRIFKLNRIVEIVLLDEEFPHLDFPKDQDAKATTYNKIRLKFPKRMSYRVYDEFDESQIEYLENGDLIASAKMPEDAWLIGYLLSFGTNVEVLEPLCLKEALAKQAKEIYENNKP